jgi:hypothetical protein
MSIQVESLSEYVNAITEILPTFDCHSSDVWYRGISNTAHSLTPGVHWRNISEAHHESMVEEFLTAYIAYEKRDDLLSSYDLYALMQHYGLPTRLLDWTVSPLTALFFALEKDDAAEKRLVWAMNPLALNKLTLGRRGLLFSESKRDARLDNLHEFLPQPLADESCTLREQTIAIVVPPKNRRISSQSGRFTVHGSLGKPVNDLFEDAGSNQCIGIEINGAQTREILLQELQWLGVTEDAIYQDLGSLAKRIMREFQVK